MRDEESRTLEDRGACLPITFGSSKRAALPLRAKYHAIMYQVYPILVDASTPPPPRRSRLRYDTCKRLTGS